MILPEKNKEEELKIEEKDREIRERILGGSEELFLRYGFKSITMDEIARHLGVSKKTLYQQFKDKDEVVYQVVSRHFDCEKSMAYELMEQAENPIHEFVIEAQQLKITLNRIHPNAIFELKKYHPKAWQIFFEHKEKWIIELLLKNLKKGLEQGLYRDDIVPEILVRLRIEQITLAFDPHVFPANRFDMKTIQVQFIEHFIQGILTDKGRQLFNHYQQNQTKNEKKI
jgi:TetR/AcrR family transcriptional regulator, cholesterol catabolism regulator